MPSWPRRADLPVSLLSGPRVALFATRRMRRRTAECSCFHRVAHYTLPAQGVVRGTGWLLKSAVLYAPKAVMTSSIATGCEHPGTCSTLPPSPSTLGVSETRIFAGKIWEMKVRFSRLPKSGGNPRNPRPQSHESENLTTRPCLPSAVHLRCIKEQRLLKKYFVVKPRAKKISNCNMADGARHFAASAKCIGPAAILPNTKSV